MATIELERTEQEEDTDLDGICHLYIFPTENPPTIPAGTKAVCGHVKQSVGFDEGRDRCVVCVSLGRSMGYLNSMGYLK